MKNWKRESRSWRGELYEHWWEVRRWNLLIELFQQILIWIVALIMLHILVG
ncbi:MAG: hypothetical protein KF861_01165 [Planctomycetaceae bacterium]|nr:hypothetical protein [Planctomycetaceae bacterium]